MIGNQRMKDCCALVLLLLGAAGASHAGTWTPLTNQPPGGPETMLLLSDGTVIVNQCNGSNVWWKLTPDSHGSYINGTWTTIASMHDTRNDYATDVMPNGKVFAAGGEYGSGDATEEVYDPIANTWTYTPTPPGAPGFSDSISETLANGNVIICAAYGAQPWIYNMASNTWTASGGTNVYQEESSWVKLPDQSILTIDPWGSTAERYIPATNSWVVDAAPPVAIYDDDGEEGPGFLLPNGKVIFFGGNGLNVIYTPSGNTSPGTWVQAATTPNGQGMCDATGAMEPNGLILICTNQQGTYNHPVSFYEYNYLTNTFTQVNGPTGLTENAPAYITNTLVIPDGGILYSDYGSVYEYTPSGSPLAAGQPTVTNYLQNSDGSYTLTGTNLTGISEGAAFGDDKQMASNYPIVKLSNSSGSVWFASTTNWSTTEVMQSGPQTTKFTLPSGLPSGTYNLQVVVNGNASASVPFTTGEVLGGIFKLIDVAGYALDDTGWGGAGTGLDQWTYGAQANQEWTLTQVSSGQYKIICSSNGLAVTGATTYAQLTLQTYSGASDQLWKVQPNGAYYNLINVGTGQAMDDWGGGSGWLVGQWTASSSNANQNWSILAP